MLAPLSSRCCRQLLLLQLPASSPARLCLVRGVSLTPVRRTVLKKPPKWASNYVRRLNPFEQLELMAALRMELETAHVAPGTAGADQPAAGATSARAEISQPTRDQLRQVAILSAVPFIGFGFFDNAIMIMAGEYIDATLGTILGLSTLAAAAIGNWISDLAGLSLAGWVEATASRFGFETPRLSPQQLELRSTRWSTVLGRCLGISVGCFLGMVPLLMFNGEEKEAEKEAGDKSEK